MGFPVLDPVCLRPSMSWAHGTRYQDGGLKGLEIVSYFVDYRLFTPLSKPLDGVLLNIFVIKCFREISVPFCTETEAQIACNSLSVDPEPKRGGVKKELIVKGNVLQAWVFPCLIKMWCDFLSSVKSHLCPIGVALVDLIMPQALILTFPAWGWVLVYRLTKIAWHRSTER